MMWQYAPEPLKLRSVTIIEKVYFHHPKCVFCVQEFILKTQEMVSCDLIVSLTACPCSILKKIKEVLLSKTCNLFQQKMFLKTQEIAPFGFIFQKFPDPLIGYIPTKF